MNTSLKGKVRQYWEQDPCGAADAGLPVGTREFFEEVERQRYGGDDFMPEVAGFDRYADKKVLEVGCGLGTDLLQFARGGAEVSAVDLTQRGVDMATRRLGLYGFAGDVRRGDAEQLPFADDSFDHVYSWGVIHITDDPEQCAHEIVRVTKPGGTVMVMIYNRYSLFSLQAWIIWGLLRGRPFRPLDDIIGDRVESPGTRVYTPRGGARLFAGTGLRDIRTRTIVTRFDVRVGRRVFLPRWVQRLVPHQVGWFLVIQGQKAG